MVAMGVADKHRADIVIDPHEVEEPALRRLQILQREEFFADGREREGRGELLLAVILLDIDSFKKYSNSTEHQNRVIKL